MSQQTAADLRAARALIERGWCKKTFARAADGKPRDPDDPDAICFCMVGALIAAIPGHVGRQDEAQSALIDEIGGGDLGEFNDACRDRGAVLAVFDRAIAAEESTD